MTPERKAELFQIFSEELERRIEAFEYHDWDGFIDDGCIEPEELEYFRRHVVSQVILSDTNE